MLIKWFRLYLPILLLIALQACSDNQAAQIAKYEQLAQQQLTQLSQLLDSGQIRNATVLSQYAQLLEKKDPQYQQLLSQLSQDATPAGPQYQALVRRLNAANNPANFADSDAQLQELQNIYEAANPAIFNDLLSDPINVIADLSQGQLPRVNAMSKEAEMLANQADDFGPGSQLVGNPSYGQWQTGSNGMSFWAWYGMYSMFSNLTRPISYDRWAGRRGYSYYNDVGRYRYSSPQQMKNQEGLSSQRQKQFSSQGKTFTSPYAKNRSGSTGLSAASRKAPAASQPQFRSNYSKNSSMRTSSSRTNRSLRRGK
ncbi:hypothetical protein [Shewanella sp. NIFS-20-20]|uniref:hypothetical protein n=1 Tax=Shewanella sp. NIFS-20-20 TaxID=2853806 RepID=UPI001C46A277|nr:hypothetical protein [Shewanella sp. NIFS-20-20]MBV7314685.1 hypothetical protein [Shewanella sp. NIFS-20-20]